MKHLAHLNKYLWQYKWHLISGILLLIGSNYLRTLQPVVVRWAFDYTEEILDTFNNIEENYSLFGDQGMVLLKYAFLIVALTIVGGIFLFLTRQTMIVMSRLIEKDLRNELFQHYNILDQRFYKKNSTGDLMSRITEDVTKVRMYLGPGLMYSVNLISIFALVIYSMISVSPKLTFYVLIPLPFLSVSIYFVTNIINKQSAVIQKQLSFLTTLSQEMYSGIRVLKSFAREKEMFGMFGENCETYKKNNLKLAKIRALFFPLMILLVGTSTIICLYVGGNLVIAGEISNGNIAEFIIYVNMLSWPVTAIGWIASMIQEAAASQERINQFLLEKPSVQPDVTKLQSNIKGDITFKNVNFTYPETGITALKNFNMTISSGDRVLIMGRTGSGKTSIFDLLLGVYPATEGLISIDSLPIGQYDLGALRSQIAYVTQDVFLFSDTIENNIAFGSNKKLSLEEIEKYAEFSSIKTEILQFTKGFQTLVGERGVTLSGGQKQRISIARALATQPQMIILDDALSAIDALAEDKILSYLDTELLNKTSILTSHRVYPHLKFDKIFIIDKGRVIESGTHDELVKKEGYYLDIYKKQLEEEPKKEKMGLLE